MTSPAERPLSKYTVIVVDGSVDAEVGYFHVEARTPKGAAYRAECAARREHRQSTGQSSDCGYDTRFVFAGHITPVLSNLL